MSNIQKQTNAKLDTLNATMNGIANTSNLIGNTSSDGSGTNNHINVDSDGKAKVLIVGSNDINGGTPHRHLTVDSNGRTLTVPLMTTTNNKLTDIVNNTASEGRITTSTSLSSVQVCGFDTSTSQFKTLACDLNGFQSVTATIAKSNSEITLDKDDLALGGSLASGNQTKWVDIGGARSIRVMCNNLSSGGTITLGIEGSQTTALGDFELIDEKTASLALSPNAGSYIAFKLLDCPYGYIRLRNDSGSPITFGKLNVNLIN
jgi:hypothetical protein